MQAVQELTGVFLRGISMKKTETTASVVDIEAG